MKNSSADELISNCEQEIKLIKEKIKSLDKFDQSRDFITKYALIRVSGIIEYAIKTIIADKCEENASQQVKNFIENKIRMNSSNPTINTIYNLLNEFDPSWKDNFKSKITGQKDFSKLSSSLISFKNIRNEFAHGGNPHITIKSIEDNFKAARKVVKILDKVVS